MEKERTEMLEDIFNNEYCFEKDFIEKLKINTISYSWTEYQIKSLEKHIKEKIDKAIFEFDYEDAIKKILQNIIKNKLHGKEKRIQIPIQKIQFYGIPTIKNYKKTFAFAKEQLWQQAEEVINRTFEYFESFFLQVMKKIIVILNQNVIYQKHFRKIKLKMKVERTCFNEFVTDNTMSFVFSIHEL